MNCIFILNILLANFFLKIPNFENSYFNIKILDSPIKNNESLTKKQRNESLKINLQNESDIKFNNITAKLAKF